MKKIQLILLLTILVTLLVPGHGAPTVAAQGTNLLQNPSFEGPYDDKGAASSWARWHRESSADQFGDCTNGYHKKPRWGQATDFVYDGGSSQYVGNNWDTWSGGMWQNVTVTPGSTYRFSFWARGYGSMDSADPSYTGLNMAIRAGIDPNGSGLWSDGDVVWGAAGNAHDQWVQFSVEATATGNTISVFTSSNWAVPGVNQCYKFLNTYFDAASLVEVGPPPTSTPLPTNTPLPAPVVTNTPLPTATPEFTATPLPTPTNTPSPTPEPPQGGRVCVNAFDDRNANGQHDSDEGYMGGVTFTVANTELMVGQAISAGTADPFCFEGVQPGSYQVTQLVPGRLEMTTAGNATIAVEEGKTVGLEFGSRLQPTDVASSDTSSPDTVSSAAEIPTTAPVATESAAPAADSGMNTTVIVGLVVIGLAVILLGGLLYAFLRRQTG
ncbi:MAG: carbohydrate binding domain-containing protein [Anaerolineales bacterium]|nr:carbohydrate binding domain-containing protein [Anaerolineales bacterium]